MLSLSNDSVLCYSLWNVLKCILRLCCIAAVPVRQPSLLPDYDQDRQRECLRLQVGPLALLGALGEVGLQDAARLIFGAVAVLLLRPSTPESCTYEMSKLLFAVSMLL